MKRALIAISLLILASNLKAEVRLFMWQESRYEKTGENLSAFYLAPRAVMEMVEADAKGDSKTAQALGEALPKDAWMYGLGLLGDATVYAKQKLLLFEPKPCGGMLQIESGTVEVDRRKSTVRVALKVIQDGKEIDFIGNGIFPIKKSPTRR